MKKSNDDLPAYDLRKEITLLAHQQMGIQVENHSAKYCRVVTSPPPGWPEKGLLEGDIIEVPISERWGSLRFVVLNSRPFAGNEEVRVSEIVLVSPNCWPGSGELSLAEGHTARVVEYDVHLLPEEDLIDGASWIGRVPADQVAWIRRRPPTRNPACRGTCSSAAAPTPAPKWRSNTRGGRRVFSEGSSRASHKNLNPSPSSKLEGLFFAGGTNRSAALYVGV